MKIRKKTNLGMGTNRIRLRPESPVRGLFILLLIFSLACGKWSEQDYNEINSIRKAAIVMVELSEYNSYDSKEAEVTALKKRIDVIIEKNKPKIGSEMLKQICAETRRTWGGFVALWREQGTLGKAAVVSVKERIDDAFLEVLALGKQGAGGDIN